MNIETITAEINVTLANQTKRFCAELTEIDDQLIPVASALTEYLAEGKRFRPIFAALGFLGAHGKLTPEIYKAVSALEFLQASALIHDDLMDASDTRRGKPAIHKQFSATHGAQFGNAAAILIGDLALIWSEAALNQSGLAAETLFEANNSYEVMRTELMAGQFLDIFEQTQKSHSVERSLKIARYKSGKYSIERPLHFGAAMTGLSDSKELANLNRIYSEYGLPLGEAFQLRDDLLGVFGDPKLTGKPAGDDLREGKKTALIAYAHDRGSNVTKTLIDQKLGTNLSDSEIELLRQAIEESGAVIHVEDLIEKLAEASLDAIAQGENEGLEPLAAELLNQMVTLVTKRFK